MGSALDNIYAVYPYAEQLSISNEGVLNVTLPARQVFKQSSFGIGANTMVSVTTGNTLRFRNVGGYLAFKLYGDNVRVSSITLEGNNHDKLSGAARIAMEVGGLPAVTMQADATESVTLVCKEPVTIGSSKTDYTEFWFVIPPTTFAQGFTVTVNTDNGGTFSKSVSAKFVVDRNSLKRMSALEVVPTQPQAEAVDLGLPSGIKWASFNVGATSPEDYGDYFAWGETAPKSEYDWSTYIWCNGTEDALTKYNIDSSYGDVDNKTLLDLKDDAACANWGDKWRMPTDAECTELCEECTWTWTTQNDVAGYKIVSNENGNSIFLPVAGCRDDTGLFDVGSLGYYWSSSLNTDYPGFAWNVFINSGYVYRVDDVRYYGFSVRPVTE